MQVCPMFTGPVPHVGGVLAAPAAFTVLIGGMPAARMGDSTSHGGVITLGCMTVLIGG